MARVSHQVQGLALGLEAYSKQVSYAVQSALRRTAQATKTTTIRSLAERRAIKQKLIRRRVLAFGRKLGPGNYRFRAWFGVKGSFDVSNEPRLIDDAKAKGYAATFFRGRAAYVRRAPNGALQFYRFQFDGTDGQVLHSEASKHLATTYRDKLRRELGRRARKLGSQSAKRARINRLDNLILRLANMGNDDG